MYNHYSLLNRSSEESGILKYCKDNNIFFFFLYDFRTRSSY